MKKLLTILLLFCFVFTVSAAFPVQSKTPQPIEKVSIEKEVIAATTVAIVSLRSEQTKVINSRSSEPDLPYEPQANYNHKEQSILHYVADLSRKNTRHKSKFPIST